MDFSTFKNKYIIEGDLLVLNALHIGAEMEKNDCNSPFIEYGYGQYYVPGSSFRGYLRSKLERLLQKDNNFNFIDKASGESLNMADVYLLFGYTNLEDDEDIKARLKNKLGELYKSVAGRIYIADMPLLEPAQAITRDGIKIDGETGTTQSGAKFDYDVVPAGTKFKILIELENIDKYQLDLIFLGLKDIWNEDLFGGMLSRGIGKCKIENISLKTIDSSNMKEYLFNGEEKIKAQPMDKFPEITNLDLK